MKSFYKVVLVALLFASTATMVHAQDKTPALGWANFAIKANYVQFTSSLWDDNDLKNAPYVALEGYGSVYRNLYLGGEIGYGQAAGTVTGVNTELTIVPLEMNLKYVLDFSDTVKLDLGGGLSYTWAEGKVFSTTITGTKQKDGAWGGQAFIDLQFVVKRFFFGANFKYQATQEILTDGNLNNFRGGIQAGIMF